LSPKKILFLAVGAQLLIPSKLAKKVSAFGVFLLSFYLKTAFCVRPIRLSKELHKTPFLERFFIGGNPLEKRRNAAHAFE